MKQTILLHNPGAGDEDHVKSDLVEAIEKQGFNCVYFSIKNDDSWKQQLDEADFAVVAGGDGTIRGVVKELVKRTALDKKIPLAVLPMGTANNLSKTLGLDQNTRHETYIKNWKKNRRQIFDVGIIKNADTSDFFIESAGYGIFPLLIKKMDTLGKHQAESAKAELKLALEVLHEIILSAAPERYRIEAEDKVYEGQSLLLEVMNIRSVGPNLPLSPQAKTDDGVFDVVYVDEAQRQDFANYIKKLIDGEQPAFPYKTFKAKRLSISCESKHMHVDDELVVPLKSPVALEVRDQVLEFLI